MEYSNGTLIKQDIFNTHMCVCVNTPTHPWKYSWGDSLEFSEKRTVGWDQGQKTLPRKCWRKKEQTPDASRVVKVAVTSITDTQTGNSFPRHASEDRWNETQRLARLKKTTAGSETRITKSKPPRINLLQRMGAKSNCKEQPCGKKVGV